MNKRPSIRDEKIALRKIYSARRAAIPDDLHRVWSEKIAENFFSSPEYASSNTVLLYLSINREVRTRGLVDRVLADGKRLALPVCSDNGQMTFRYITGRAQLVKGFFSAPEPSPECEEFAGDTPTVCIIPAIAFDKSGYRLGYGKGYYDRYLSKFRVIKVGFSFDSLLVDSLPHGRFDAACDMVVTEKGVYRTHEKQ
jgi:5-formyltetrahydrofolate cyclo-ligase